jgi:hypothetical protein
MCCYIAEVKFDNFNILLNTFQRNFQGFQKYVFPASVVVVLPTFDMKFHRLKVEKIYTRLMLPPGGETGSLFVLITKRDRERGERKTKFATIYKDTYTIKMRHHIYVLYLLL